MQLHAAHARFAAQIFDGKLLVPEIFFHRFDNGVVRFQVLPNKSPDFLMFVHDQDDVLAAVFAINLSAGGNIVLRLNLGEMNLRAFEYWLGFKTVKNYDSS